MFRRLGFIAGGVVVLLLAVAPAVSAHTQVKQTIPADGAVLELSPQRVGVVFNDAIQQERSSIVVLDAAGTTVAEGGLDANDARRLTAELPPLANGGYIVRWTAYSADNELLRDQFTFEVAVATPAPTGPAPTVAPSASPSASAAASTPEPATPAPSLATAPTPTPGGRGNGQADPVQVLVPLVVGGAIVAGIALWLVRRRRA